MRSSTLSSVAGASRLQLDHRSLLEQAPTDQLVVQHGDNDMAVQRGQRALDQQHVAITNAGVAHVKCHWYAPLSIAPNSLIRTSIPVGPHGRHLDSNRQVLDELCVDAAALDFDQFHRHRNCNALHKVVDATH
jgi:hypothetical protein